MYEDFEVIHRYTRREAVADGTLIDVTDSARAMGIKYPTAVTRTVWCRYVEVSADTDNQDEAGRLWDLLWMLRTAIVRSRETDTILFDLLVQQDNGKPKQVTLKAVCGPNDDASPCITVMMPDED